MEPEVDHIRILCHAHELPFKTVAFIVGLSLVGGLAHFFDRAKYGKFQAHWLIELAGDICYSLASGFAVWFLAVGSSLSEYTSAALAIVAGHLGARLIFAVQNAVIERTVGIITKDRNQGEK